METTMTSSICRCCASEGSFKDMLSSYRWMGEEEVYYNMLQDCFNIALDQLDDNDLGICEVCITQLRNSANFKKQVLQTELQFKRRVQDPNHKGKIVKVEVDIDPEESQSDDNMQTEFLDPDFELSDKDIKSEDSDDDKPLIASAKKRLAASKPSTSKAKKAKAVPKAETSKRSDEPVCERKKRGKHDCSATPERVEHRVNLTSILQHSNATPFRDKTMRGFSCLYCSKDFADIDKLRIHTAQKSEKDKINKMLDYKLSYNPIKVDITNLYCTLCQMAINDLDELKDHLATEHNKTIYKNIKDIILPFRLDDGHNFTCVLCSAEHVSFKNLYHHMSSHYRNYCCNECGAGYITIAALRKHGKTHYQGEFPCKYCGNTYTSISKKRNHEKGVHEGGWHRNKCPHCPEIFVSYYDRSEHLVKVHNKDPVTYPCNACHKVYKKKFELNRHIKHHHLQQKSYFCEQCHCKFFSKRGLADHVAKHSGGVTCSCDVCGKKFSRLRTLKEHIKIHEDDKRYQCEICSKTFMQKCSLKAHTRLHQDNLDIFKEFDDVKHLIDNREMTLKQIAAENKRKEQAEKLKQQQPSWQTLA